MSCLFPPFLLPLRSLLKLYTPSLSPYLPLALLTVLLYSKPFYYARFNVHTLNTNILQQSYNMIIDGFPQIATAVDRL